MADDRARAEGSEEDRFNRRVEELLDEKAPDFSKTLNIVVIGRVSAGKSSLINALLRRTRENPVFEVGATSGTTTKPRILHLDERVLLIDSPGLEDVRAENSEKAMKLLASVDVGILVVTGSADSSQKKHLDELRRTAHKVFVALSKIDQWDGDVPFAVELGGSPGRGLGDFAVRFHS
jgi:small GTP-binding protein